MIVSCSYSILEKSETILLQLIVNVCSSWSKNLHVFDLHVFDIKIYNHYLKHTGLSCIVHSSRSVFLVHACIQSSCCWKH